MMKRQDAEEKPVSGEVGTVLFLRGWDGGQIAVITVESADQWFSCKSEAFGSSF